MPLAGTLEKLYARRRFGIRPGVGRVRLLLDRLGNPEKSYQSVHVVGTNGKGSTSAFLTSILNCSGMRTGLFSSPHLVNFTERFRINGNEIEEQLLEKLLATVLSHAPEDATFFEIVTALAAFAFAESEVDCAVMEAGMGGRSDATAAIPAIMTMVTPISLDHCDYLGPTVEQIAREKAGIIEPGSCAVFAAQVPAVRDILARYATHNSVRHRHAAEDFSADWSREGLNYQGTGCNLSGLKPGLAGHYQGENAALALAGAETLQELGFSIGEEHMRAGIATARWPGRMELVQGLPRLMLDGAHNPAGAAALAASVADYPYRRLLLVCGTMADKDVRQIFAPLLPLASRCFCVKPTVERALDDSELTKILLEAGAVAVACGSVGNGILMARSESQSDDLILVCGSLFTVGEAKAWLAGKGFEGIRG